MLVLPDIKYLLELQYIVIVILIMTTTGTSLANINQVYGREIFSESKDDGSLKSEVMVWYFYHLSG